MSGWVTFSCNRKLGGAHPPHSPVHALYYTIYLQTNEFYAGDQTLWTCFAMQLAKLFLTISRHSLELHKTAIVRRKKIEVGLFMLRHQTCDKTERTISRWTETAGSLPVPCCKPSTPNHWLALIWEFLIKPWVGANTLGQCFLTSLCQNSVPDRWERGDLWSQKFGGWEISQRSLAYWKFSAVLHKL